MEEKSARTGAADRRQEKRAAQMEKIKPSPRAGKFFEHSHWEIFVTAVTRRGRGE